jgi:hypothetical protein
MIRLVGLYREAECSPGRHRSNDALLLERVASCLRKRGYGVELKPIEKVVERPRHAALVFSMCQGPAALESLAAWEAEGTRIVNSPRAALRTYREELPGLMHGAGVPFPFTTLVETAKPDDPFDVNGGIWLKRGGVHASVVSDVQRIGSIRDLRAGLREFASRGIARAAVQAHQTGDEVKFYGVAGRFFHWFHPAGVTPHLAVDAGAIERLASRAAAAAGLDIYGGDVIVAPSGELTLIDLNDWPSFAPCRERAADAIADRLIRYLDDAWNPRLVSSAHRGAL